MYFPIRDSVASTLVICNLSSWRNVIKYYQSSTELTFASDKQRLLTSKYLLLEGISVSSHRIGCSGSNASKFDLGDTLYNLPHFLQINAWTLLSNRPPPLPLKSFQIHQTKLSSGIMLRWVTQSFDTMSLNNLHSSFFFPSEVVTKCHN
jgi:hypothetical protein